jgi:hypothetical protein
MKSFTFFEVPKNFSYFYSLLSIFQFGKGIKYWKKNRGPFSSVSACFYNTPCPAHFSKLARAIFLPWVTVKRASMPQRSPTECPLLRRLAPSRTEVSPLTATRLCCCRARVAATPSENHRSGQGRRLTDKPWTWQDADAPPRLPLASPSRHLMPLHFLPCRVKPHGSKRRLVLLIALLVLRPTKHHLGSRLAG